MTIFPQCTEGVFWNIHFKEIETILEVLTNNNNCYFIDKNRINVIGIGLGAYGAWNFAIQKPELFASIVSIAGGVMFPKYLDRIINIPA
jgi:predicted peptidase